MARKYQVGDKVKWPWGDGHGNGEIAQRFTDDVSRTIGGTEIRRTATAEQPAYLIKQDDGGRVLKSHSELRKAD